MNELTRAAIQQMLEKETLQNMSENKKWQAYWITYEAAVMVGNNDDAEQMRGMLHAQLDKLLDSGATTAMLTRQYSEAKY